MFNTLKSDDACTHVSKIRSLLVPVLACHLFGKKPLPELMLTYYQLNSLEQTYVKFETESIFTEENDILNCCQQNCSLVILGARFNIKISPYQY